MENENFLNGIKRTICECYSRVVGYLRPISQWNEGKKNEYTCRKTYKHPEEKKD